MRITGYYNGVFTNGINTRQGAQVLVESTVFENTTEDIGWYDGKVTGYAIANDVSLGSGTNTAPKGNIIGNSVARHFPIVPSNILGRVFKHGAFNQDLGALAGIDTVGEDAVVVACDTR